MTQVQNGQCGLCAHFGENHPQDSKIIQIRLKHEAPENLVEECGHPSLAPASSDGHPDQRLRRLPGRAGADVRSRIVARPTTAKRAGANCAGPLSAFCHVAGPFASLDTGSPPP